MTRLEWYPQQFVGGMAEVVACQNDLGDRWRLPSVVELVAHFDYDNHREQPAPWQPVVYWSSQKLRSTTEVVHVFERIHGRYWGVCFSTGSITIEYARNHNAARFCREVTE